MRWSTKSFICLLLAQLAASELDGNNKSPLGKWVIGFLDLCFKCLQENWFQRESTFAIEIHGCHRKCSLYSCLQHKTYGIYHSLQHTLTVALLQLGLPQQEQTASPSWQWDMLVSIAPPIAKATDTRAPAGRRSCPVTVHYHNHSPRKHLAGFLFSRNSAAKSLK